MITLPSLGLDGLVLSLPMQGIPESVRCDYEHCDEMIDPKSAIATVHRLNGERTACFYKDANHLNAYTAD